LDMENYSYIYDIDVIYISPVKKRAIFSITVNNIGKKIFNKNGRNNGENN